MSEQIDSAANNFGFGVPEERKELDLAEFDEEIDTKEARRFKEDIKFTDGVNKEFEKYKKQK